MRDWKTSEHTIPVGDALFCIYCEILIVFIYKYEA